MVSHAKSLTRLIAEFSKLPGIGPKSAERLAMYVLRGSLEEAKALAYAVVKAKQNLGYCKICSNLTDDGICTVCQDPHRDKGTICIVEEPKDLLAIEKSGTYHGVYHVLLGAISPLEGIAPEDLRIGELLARLKGETPAKEIIIATNSNTEGEITALYLAKLIKPLGIKATRIACGIPAGGNLEYADQTTLGKALQGRQEV
ncbi:recombination mediator RecR [Candidatus Omnitrophota bacterium]